MRYVLREKLWSIGGDFTVKDGDGHDRFYIDGKALSLSHEMVFEDMDRRPLASIKRRLLALRNTYDLYVGDRLFAVVTEGWLPLARYRFAVDVGADGAGPEDLTITGDFWNREYTFERDGQTVATVSRKWFSWRDTYGVEVADESDAVLVLACAVVVDLCTRKKSEE